MATLPHGSKRPTSLDRSEESIGDTELALDDEGHDVVRKVTRVRPQMRADDARLAFRRNPRREVPRVRGLLKRDLHGYRRYAGEVGQRLQYPTAPALRQVGRRSSPLATVSP